MKAMDTWPGSARSMWTLILGVISLGKQRHFEHTEKLRFLELLNINTEWRWVESRCQTENSVGWIYSLRCDSAQFPSDSATFGLLRPPLGQTSLHLNRFNSSTQSGEKWAETGKCMFSDLCFLQVSFIIQDSWPLHLGDGLRILVRLWWVSFFCCASIEVCVKGTNVCVCNNTVTFLSKELTWVFGNIFKICHTQNNIFSWYINVS